MSDINYKCFNIPAVENQTDMDSSLTMFNQHEWRDAEVDKLSNIDNRLFWGLIEDIKVQAVVDVVVTPKQSKTKL